MNGLAQPVKRERVPVHSLLQIVFSTNLAETSVTIDDVVHVVDTGRVKETGFDVVSRMQQLIEGWVRAGAH